MKHLYFDHSYTADHQHRFLKKLWKYGFRRVEHVNEHPGGSVCRFVMFHSKNRMKRNYLEFVHVKPKGSKVKVPGLSFGWNDNLEKFHKKMVRTEKLKTKFVHRNYNWQENAKDRLPGWNFIDFKNTGIRSLYIWMTEYEANPKRKIKKSRSHANGVTKIVGFEMDLNRAGERLFRAACGIGTSDHLQLSDGTYFYFKSARTTRLRNIILKSKNLKQFLRKYGADREIQFRGKPAALIRNPNPDMWDIIIL